LDTTILRSELLGEDGDNTEGILLWSAPETAIVADMGKVMLVKAFGTFVVFLPAQPLIPARCSHLTRPLLACRACALSQPVASKCASGAAGEAGTAAEIPIYCLNHPWLATYFGDTILDALVRLQHLRSPRPCSPSMQVQVQVLPARVT
jgi:hypothetical protein